MRRADEVRTSAEVGVSVRSLRYYEQHELISSQWTRRGWRDLEAPMIDRVILIQHLFAAGSASSSRATGATVRVLSATISPSGAQLHRFGA